MKRRPSSPYMHMPAMLLLVVLALIGTASPHQDFDQAPLQQLQPPYEARPWNMWAPQWLNSWAPGFFAPPASLEEPEEVIIAVMGATGSGKTTFINAASGGNLETSAGLASCTNTVQAAPSFMLDGRLVTLIDTPGFDDTTKSDTDVLKMIAHFLSITYQKRKTLAGIVFVHRITDYRFGGLSSRNFKMFRELCGDNSLKNVVILTNMWNEVDKRTGLAKEEELATRDIFFKPALDKGARMMRHDGSRKSALKVIRSLLDNVTAMVPQIVREIVIEQKGILQTAAGQALNKDLLAQKARHEEQMKKLGEEWEAAMQAKDEETRREVEEQAKKLQEDMSRVEKESKKLASDFQKERANFERRLKEIEEEARREQERIQEENRLKIEELERKLFEDANISRSERERLVGEIEELRRKQSSFGFPGDGVATTIGRVIDTLLPFLLIL